MKHYLFAGDGLLGSLEELIDNLLRLKCYEAESFSLVLCLIKWHFNFNYLKCKYNMNKPKYYIPRQIWTNVYQWPGFLFR